MADASDVRDGVIIEAALHELVSKSANPHVPYGPEEVAADAAACAEAGATLGPAPAAGGGAAAALVHSRARASGWGEQRWHDAALYTSTVAGMRAWGAPADL